MKEIQFKGGFRILHDIRLIIQYYGGYITTDAMLATKSALVETSDYDSSYGFYCDVTESDFEYLLNDLSTIKQFAKDAHPIDYSEKSKMAVIYKTPNQFAYVKLYKETSIDIFQEIELFEDKQAALDWLGVKLTLKEVEAHILQIQSVPNYIV